MARSIYWAGRIVIVAALVVVAGVASASAQDPAGGFNPYDPNLPKQPGGPVCSPYVPPGCAGGPGATITTYESEYDFPQVFVGIEGQPNDYLTYVSLKNQAPSPLSNAVVITVSWEGADAPVTRTFVLQPRARMSVRLNDWPELLNIAGGLTVEVQMHYKGTAGVAMHPASDFWHGAKILEGR